MPQPVSFILRGILLLLILGNCPNLIAQTDHSQALFSASKNYNSPEPVKKSYDDDSKSWYSIYNSNNGIHVYVAVTDQA